MRSPLRCCSLHGTLIPILVTIISFTGYKSYLSKCWRQISSFFVFYKIKKKKRMSAIFCHNVQPSFDISRKLPLYAIIMIIVVVGSSPNYLGSATKAYSPFSPVYNYVSFILSSDYQLILLYLVLRCIT